jgi:cell division protein FtsB
MNSSSADEYEEVESPFATRTTSEKSKLRTRKNVFNRPFAAEASVAPAVFETTGKRRNFSQVDDTELIQRPSSLSETTIDYLDEDEDEVEEEEIVERRPARVTPKKLSKKKKNLLPQIGWSVIGLLVLRLIFMDRGVWDYFSTESAIKDKNNELYSIQRENKELKTEISRIQIDKNYQRQLAKEHLGVIAVDEFLILFAGESVDTPTSKAQL